MSGRRVSVGRVRRLHRVLTTGSLIAATTVVGAGLAGASSSGASSSGAASSDARAAREHVSDQSIAAHRFGPQLMVRKAALSAGAAPQSHHVVLALTVDDANQQYTSGLTVDDQVLENAQPLTLPWAKGNVTLSVGVTYAAAGGTDFYFDNVRADFVL